MFVSEVFLRRQWTHFVAHTTLWVRTAGQMATVFVNGFNHKCSRTCEAARYSKFGRETHTQAHFGARFLARTKFCGAISGAQHSCGMDCSLKNGTEAEVVLPSNIRPVVRHLICSVSHSNVAPLELVDCLVRFRVGWCCYAGETG